MPTKLDKRKDQYSKMNLQTAEALANEIQRMKDENDVLDIENTNNLIKLYLNMGNEMQDEYKKIKDNQEKTILYDKMAKRFAKDYSKLLRYKKHLEDLAEADAKRKKKNNTNDKTRYMDIESFYESLRSKTITLTEDEMDGLKAIGNSSNIRYKVPFIVDDEPVKGKKKGDSCVGYFTMSESYDTDDKDTIMELKAKAKRKMLDKKFPGVSEYLESIDYKKFINLEFDEKKNLSDLAEDLEDRGYQFGINMNKDKGKGWLKDIINKANGTDEEKQRSNNDIDGIDSDEKYFAYTEYISYMLHVKNSMIVRESCDINYGVDTSQRNALTSVFADLLGCSQYVAYSEKVKIKTKRDGKDVVLKGVMMMPANGMDNMTELSGSQLEKLDRMSFEKSPGLVKNIASIQLLDHIIRNPDRFFSNTFTTMNSKNKLTAVEAIDNDTTFIAGDNPQLIPWSRMGIIPKSMADTIKALDTNMLEILMRGYGLSDKEIDVVIKGINDCKKKIVKSEQEYHNFDPRFISTCTPRIIDDKDLDKYSINDHMTMTYGLFTRLLEDADRENIMIQCYQNEYNKCGNLAKDVIVDYLSVLKPNTAIIKSTKELNFGDVESEILKDKYKEMKSEYECIDKLYEEELPGLKFLHTTFSKDNMVWAFSDKYPIFKNRVAEALEKTNTFINAMRDDIFEHGGKYDEYQTLKAEMDYYKKEYSKDGEISEKNRESLNTMENQIKELENSPEIIAINAALKNRDALEQMIDKFNSIEPLVKDIPKAAKRLDDFIDKCSDNDKLKNPYEGSKQQAAASKLYKELNHKFIYGDMNENASEIDEKNKSPRNSSFTM